MEDGEDEEEEIAKLSEEEIARIKELCQEILNELDKVKPDQELSDEQVFAMLEPAEELSDILSFGGTFE